MSRREGRERTVVAKVIGLNCCGPSTSNVLPAKFKHGCHRCELCQRFVSSIHNYFGIFILLLQVGPTCGRKMIKGFLKSKGIDAGDRRVGKASSVVSALYHAARCANVQRNINPLPYKADYFRHKLHIDQNEKVVMYGLTHACASDGYSGKLVSFAPMPIKNNSVIYDQIYR